MSASITRAVAALVAGAVLTGAGYAVDAAVTGDPASEALGPGEVTVTIDAEYSQFSPDHLTVRAGTLVRFVIRNHDPIHHEFILGPEHVHDAHAHGTERFHPPVPGEVSLDPNATAMTFYEFDDPGTLRFVCHLPGHEAYGMVGEIEVIE